jgi:hypothetical protein
LTIEDSRPAAKQDREAAIVHLLQRLWTYSTTTKSDDARVWADEIAEAASRQLITTQVVPRVGEIYGRLWKLTPLGTALLFEQASLLTSEEQSYANTYCQR